MITETRDRLSGITRFELGTVRPDICRMNIEKSGFMLRKARETDYMRYSVKYSGCEIDVISTDTRTILFSLNRYAMHEFLKCIEGDERRGTSWIYDDSNKNDYASRR